MIYLKLILVTFPPNEVPGFISTKPLIVVFPGTRFRSPTHISFNPHAKTGLVNHLTKGMRPIKSEDAEKSTFKYDVGNVFTK